MEWLHEGGVGISRPYITYFRPANDVDACALANVEMLKNISPGFTAENGDTERGYQFLWN